VDTASESHAQTWHDRYMDCLTFQIFGAISDVDTARWRQLNELRASVGAPFPAGVARLTRQSAPTPLPLHSHDPVSAWTYGGLHKLLGDGPTRVFACECALRVLPLWEARHPRDHRPRHAVDVALRFAWGEVAVEELSKANGAAFRSFLPGVLPTTSVGAIYNLHPVLWATDPAPTGSVERLSMLRATTDTAARLAPDYAAERRWQTERAARYIMAFPPVKDCSGRGR
jgi:hypothetical protein